MKILIINTYVDDIWKATGTLPVGSVTPIFRFYDSHHGDGVYTLGFSDTIPNIEINEEIKEYWLTLPRIKHKERLEALIYCDMLRCNKCYCETSNKCVCSYTEFVTKVSKYNNEQHGSDFTD